SALPRLPWGRRAQHTRGIHGGLHAPHRAFSGYLRDHRSVHLSEHIDITTRAIGRSRHHPGRHVGGLYDPMGGVCNIAMAHLGGNAVNVSKWACFTAAALMPVAFAAFAHEPYLDDRPTATSVVRSSSNAINSREY